MHLTISTLRSTPWRRVRRKCCLCSQARISPASQRLIAGLAIEHRLPTMFIFKSYVEAGGLMSYGVDFVDMNRRIAGHVAKILEGAKPADIPVKQPTKFELTVNLKTAKSIGVEIPLSIQLRADQVIE
jgi:putative ABC transport system substrate-binding protein